jgi:hypothetical protein
LTVLDRSAEDGEDGVDLLWIPLGAGVQIVRWNGRVFEAVAARLQHRTAEDLYHSALEVRRGSGCFVVEMAPAWGNKQPDRGVVATGPVGLPWLGRSRFFRYEIRRWRDGTIPDRSFAVGEPVRVSSGRSRAERVLELVPEFPTFTWGRDEVGAGEMWNSNSLVSWLLARSGHDMDAVQPPLHGRAPGWSAGLAMAARG